MVVFKHTTRAKRTPILARYIRIEAVGTTLEEEEEEEDKEEGHIQEEEEEEDKGVVATSRAKALAIVIVVTVCTLPPIKGIRTACAEKTVKVGVGVGDR